MSKRIRLTVDLGVDDVIDHLYRPEAKACWESFSDKEKWECFDYILDRQDDYEFEEGFYDGDLCDMVIEWRKLNSVEEARKDEAVRDRQSLLKAIEDNGGEIKLPAKVQISVRNVKRDHDLSDIVAIRSDGNDAIFVTREGDELLLKDLNRIDLNVVKHTLYPWITKFVLKEESKQPRKLPRKYTVNEAVDMNKPLWEGWSAMDYAKDNEMIMDMIMSGRSNTYRNDRIPKNKAELKKAIMDNCTPNVPKLQRAVVDYFANRYGLK